MVKKFTGRQGFLYRNAEDRSYERFAGHEVLTEMSAPDKYGVSSCLMHDQFGTKRIEVANLSYIVTDYPNLPVTTDGAIRRYVFSVTRSLSRLINASIGGWSGETLSGRAYREDISWLKYVLDKVWFLIDAEENHCRDCYLLDAMHSDYPEQGKITAKGQQQDEVIQSEVRKVSDVE